MGKPKYIDIKNIKPSADSVTVDISEEEEGKAEKFAKRVNPAIPVTFKDKVVFRNKCSKPFQILKNGRPWHVVQEIPAGGSFQVEKLKDCELSVVPVIPDPIVEEEII